jgi:hypothetical protein
MLTELIEYLVIYFLPSTFMNINGSIAQRNVLDPFDPNEVLDISKFVQYKIYYNFSSDYSGIFSNGAERTNVAVEMQV